MLEDDESHSDQPVILKNQNADLAIYRDRARERREGKNADYLQSGSIRISTAQEHDANIFGSTQVGAEMSQYLGGDESHTHLVKGLDRQLADRERRSIFNPRSPEVGRDALLQKYTSIPTQPGLSEHRRDLDISTLFSRIQSSTCSNVGKGVLSHLQTLRHRPTTGPKDTATAADITAQSSFQKRTHILFSLNANIHNQAVSWEMPEEIIMSRNISVELHALPWTWNSFKESNMLLKSERNNKMSCHSSNT